MKRLFAKIWIAVACCIVMMHAVIPHYHHDLEYASGFVFETEVACHCEDVTPSEQAQTCCGDEHDHHSHHPFNTCRLQELLSQLVLTSKEDETYMALNAIAVQELFMPVPLLALECECDEVLHQRCYPSSAPNLPAEYGRAVASLRGPPHGC